MGVTGAGGAAAATAPTAAAIAAFSMHIGTPLHQHGSSVFPVTVHPGQCAVLCGGLHELQTAMLAC